MEAQRFPEDYDGIVAGAPANYWTHLLAGAAWDMQATLARPDSYIPAAKLPAIQAAAWPPATLTTASKTASSKTRRTATSIRTRSCAKALSPTVASLRRNSPR